MRAHLERSISIVTHGVQEREHERYDPAEGKVSFLRCLHFCQCVFAKALIGIWGGRK